MSIPVSLWSLKGNEGFILAEALFNPTSEIPLCPASKPLDENIIEQLKKYFSKGKMPSSNLTIKVTYDSKTLTDEQLKIVKNIEEQNCDVPSYLSEGLHDQTLDALKKTYRASKQNLTDTLKIVNECIDDIAVHIQDNPDISYSLGEYKRHFDNEDSVFEHSMRVAQFSVALANIYNQNLTSHDGYINLKSIGTAALLHDYGTSFKNADEMKKLSLFQLGNNFLSNYPTIPSDLLQQPYNERFRIVYAYSSLKNFLDNSTLTMILLSSESENGKVGLGIKKDKTDAVSMSAKIIFLCNLYDSLLYNTISTNQSLENVSSTLNQLAENGAINKELTKLFADNIPLYSVGVRVLLSTGEYATVVERFKGNDSYRPVVKTLVNPPMQPSIIDLRTTTNVTILNVVGSNEQLSDKINEITKQQLETMAMTSIPYENQSDNIIVDGEMFLTDPQDIIKRAM